MWSSFCGAVCLDDGYVGRLGDTRTIAIVFTNVGECKPLDGDEMTMAMTMTHSFEVTNVNQKPGPTDMSAGVMTPLNGQRRLLVLCSRQSTESRVKKDQQAFAVTNSIEFKKHVDTQVFQEKMCNLNKAAKSTDSIDKGNKVSGKVLQTLSSIWFELTSPSTLQFFDV